MITLVIGGARSGKSATAERLVTEQAGAEPVTYIATGVVTDGDADFAARVQAHRDRRPVGWRTVECSADLAQALLDVTGPVLVDSLGTWVAAGFGPDRDDDEVGASSGLIDAGAATAPPAPLDGLRRALAFRATLATPTVLVTEEVGLGVHPATPVGRRFRDELGAVNLAVADLADDVLLVVAGRAFRPVDR